MSFNNISMALMSASGADKPSLFPFSFRLHLIFVIIGVVFFAARFIMQKRPGQLVMAGAMALSLAIWLSDNKLLFYTVGLLELMTLIICFVLSIVFPAPAENKSETADSSDDDADDSEDDADDNSEDDADEEASEEEDNAEEAESDSNDGGEEASEE